MYFVPEYSGFVVQLFIFNHKVALRSHKGPQRTFLTTTITGFFSFLGEIRKGVNA